LDAGGRKKKRAKKAAAASAEEQREKQLLNKEMQQIDAVWLLRLASPPHKIVFTPLYSPLILLRCDVVPQLLRKQGKKGFMDQAPKDAELEATSD